MPSHAIPYHTHFPSTSTSASTCIVWALDLPLFLASAAAAAVAAAPPSVSSPSTLLVYTLVNSRLNPPLPCQVLLLELDCGTFRHSTSPFIQHFSYNISLLAAVAPVPTWMKRLLT
ncbi:uncharacterized protein LY89DRAFT_122110 [Mollisia scopiformis]|uniref:Uncharacterized protein n=1 Tax=Mollisia scopiformis TaxID=149040 RepID=A0A194X3K2_MOLSC|nr:uncharacterized protein LY89DRAFT_122110 [Mollisia scopiformis]KUJ14775.1 hypothetical protein LY89DRAFT_122110 [Mollisia scopiformis]